MKDMFEYMQNNLKRAIEALDNKHYHVLKAVVEFSPVENKDNEHGKNHTTHMLTVHKGKIQKSTLTVRYN